MTSPILTIASLRASARRAIAVLCVATVGVLCVPSSAHGQYFGRNKPQYEHFDFRVLNGPHFDLHFYPEMAEPARDAARMLERWYTRESTLLDHQFTHRDVILYADAPDFQQTNVIEGELSEGTGGVTEALHSRVVLPLTGVSADNDHVLGHELVHVFQYDIAEGDTMGGLNAMASLPLWVVEGMAEYLSVGPRDPHTAMWMRDAVLHDDIPSIRKLGTDPRYFPYRYGQALWAYIGGRWGDATVPRLYRASLRSGWDRAVKTVLGMDVDTLSMQWHAELKRAYEPLMQGRTAPERAGTPVVVKNERGAMNVSPALSPDGKLVAFFSERGAFSVDLYLADATTGKIIKQLASPTRAGQHFDALSFIASAGAWSPDSRRFAAVVYAQGDNELQVLDVESRDVVQRIKVNGVSAISGPAWSPDGQSIALSGTAGGTSDIYVVDVRDQSVRQLTDDAYSDLQPTWSPDGRTIAFTSDRGPGTDLDRLSFGPMRIATIAAAGGPASVLSLGTEGKQINPQYSPDGASIYFISDADGFSDIYRATLATGQVARLTRVATGVSGVTYLSPAMSVAAQTGRVLFSVFERGGMNIYALDANAVAGAPAPSGGPDAGMLPPFDRQAAAVPTYLADADRGLVAAGSFTVEPYRSHLQLDYVGAPTLGVATGSFGTAVGGSASVEFGETLGNRIVGVGIGGQGRVQDFGGELYYLDRGHRVNWMLQASRSPYVSGFITEDTTSVSGPGGPVPAALIQQVLVHTYFNEIGGALQYPFSATQRVELSLSGTRVNFGSEVRRITIVGNQVVDDNTMDSSSAPGLSFAQASAALVGDNSYAGYTSPLLGSRYRFEAGPTFGGIHYITALADARRYFWHRPFTLAFRGMHYGRYGGGSEDSRISPEFVGSSTLVRGYAAESFSGQECTSTPSGSCPEFDRLVGSRIAVANTELRIQLLGPAQLALIGWDFLPIEISPFVDAGLAWTKDEAPQFRFDRNTTDRVPVVSTGLSLRTNLFGYAVIEVFYASPFQRPGKDHVWGFQLAPGW